jgi:hypothetical protein
MQLIRCIDASVVDMLEEKYYVSKLVTYIRTRKQREIVERIIGIVLSYEKQVTSTFGDIMKYHKWGYTYNEYVNDLKNKRIPKAIIKVWTGR